MERKYIYTIAGISMAMLVYALLAPLLVSEAKSQQIDSSIVKRLTITGNAKKILMPDKASLVFALEVENDTAKDALDTNSKIMNNVINRLKDLGIDEENISTNYYNIYPVYGYRDDKVCIMIYPPPPECNVQIIIGYRVVNSIRVIVDADANIGSIIDAAVNAGINRVDGVYFFVSQELQNSITDELLEEAVKDAKAKAERILMPLNMSIVDVENIYTNYYPYPLYDSLRVTSDYPSTPIFPQQQEITASVNITFIIG